MNNLEVKCPRCGKKTIWSENPARPFCSEQCRIIDLGCWATEEYRVVGDKAPEVDQDS
ncbi:DNA gyrase inhibitor YacG [Desulfuromusa kysingii]|uniref:DNA gyrase inhibitor YacG n=1 Tax=Desulfuromusa kysingii TaxID=37625 RepID=UPI000B85F7FC|nr:DNA gyrase inhibitor YacG [Desulfuromusa kysingii]